MRHGSPKSGFTLVEVVIAITILAIITTMIYGTFSAVTDSALAARAGSEELRYRLFLMRHLSENISAAFSDCCANSDEYTFIGEVDSMTFLTTAPVMGGVSLPGDLKQVTYEVCSGCLDDGAEELENEFADDEEASHGLKITEIPLLAGNVEVDTERGEIEADTTYEAPELPVIPVEFCEFRYFEGGEEEGDEGSETFDSAEAGHLPWAVEIRINFSALEDVDIDVDVPLEGEDVEFRLVVPIAMGMGTSPEMDQIQDLYESQRCNEQSEDVDVRP